MKRRRTGLCLTLALCLLLSGCASPAAPASQTVEIAGGAEVSLPDVTAEPQIPEGTQPAKLYGQVSTTKRVASIVLEGYSDDATMQGLLKLLSQYSVPCVFFLTGSAAADYPEMVKLIDQSGFEVGNYGITGKKAMEKSSVAKNLHQFEKTQELIEQAIGKKPTLFRCNGSVYTRELLQTATMAGLTAGVEPSLFLNHRSFQAQENAVSYVQRLVRGSVITIKLGQELDLSEFPDAGEKLNERPAIDKQPGLSDDEETLDTEGYTYSHIIEVTTWLLDALLAEGYTLLTPEALQKESMAFYDQPRELTDDEALVYDEAAYPALTTADPLGVAQTAQASPDWMDGALLIGDDSVAALEDYVTWKRTQDPAFLGTTQFLAATALGVGNALQKISATSRHPLLEGQKTTLEDAAGLLQPTKIYLTLGYHDIRVYTPAQFIANLKILLYLLQRQCPTAKICVTSILPSVRGQTVAPSNGRIFTFNLALAKFCAQFDLPFVDIAYTLRDEEGNLPDDLCADPDTLGRTLTDGGCQRWIDYLLTHTF